MSDKVLEKQLAAFGIESLRVVDVPVSKQRKAEYSKAFHDTTKMMMSQMEGRQWLITVLNFCMTFTTPFVEGKPDLSAANAGSQAVGIMIFQEIMRAAPSDFYIMMQEEEARRLALKAD